MYFIFLNMYFIKIIVNCCHNIDILCKFHSNIVSLVCCDYFRIKFETIGKCSRSNMIEKGKVILRHELVKKDIRKQRISFI